MSTKTTFKRVALVAVAALSLGVNSVAPSSAVVNADSLTLIHFYESNPRLSREGYGMGLQTLFATT
jgi:hypothetical protein